MRSSEGKMRQILGKVKGKVRSKIVPVEVVQRNRQWEPWKSWNRAIPGYTARSASRSYRGHSAVVANTYSKKKHLYLASLNNTNLLHKKFAMSRGQIQKPNAYPSLLGVTEEEMQLKLEAMRLAGFTDEDAWSLMWAFPQCFAVDWNNVYQIVRYLMREAGLSLSVVAALVEKHPYMFTINSDKVIEHLKVLVEELEFSSNNITFLLNHTPAIIYGPLVPRVLDILRKIRVAGLMSGDAITHMIAHCMLEDTLPLEVSDNTVLLASILHSFQAEPVLVLKRNPDFYQLNGEWLLSVIELLSRQPLFMDWRDINEILSCRLRHISSVSVEEIKIHLERLVEVFHSVKDLVAMLRHVPYLLNPRNWVESAVTSLKGAGFSSDDMKSVFSSLEFLLGEDGEGREDLSHKLKLLMDIPGVDVKVLVENCSYLSDSFSFPAMKDRIQFAKTHKPELVCSEHLPDLMSGNERFSELCECYYGGDEVYQCHSSSIRAELTRERIALERSWDMSVVDLEEDLLKRASYTRYRVPCLIGPTAEDARDRLYRLSLTSSSLPSNAVVPLEVRELLYSSLPLAISVDCENALKVSSALGLSGRHGRFLYRNSYLLAQEYSVVLENVGKLTKLWGSELTDAAMLKFPMMCYMSLLPSVLDNMCEVVNSGNITKEGFLHMLSLCMSSHLQSIPASPSNIVITAILHNVGANPAVVMDTYPQLYQQNGECLQEVVEYLQGGPLLLGNPQLRVLLEEWPQVLFSITSKQQLVDHCNHLYALISPEDLRTKLERWGYLISPDCQVREKLEGLEESGFSNLVAQDLIKKYPEMLVQSLDHLQEKIRLLLRIPGVDCIYLEQHPEYMLLSVELIRHRLKAASKYEPGLLDVEKMSDMLCASDQEFVDKCGIGMSWYEELRGESHPRSAGGRFKKKMATFTKAKTRSPEEMAALIHGVTEEPADKISSNMEKEEQRKLKCDRTSGRSQLSLDEDEITTEHEDEDEVEDYDLLDPASVKDLILRLNRVIAREEVPEWDSLEEDIAEEEESEDYLEYEGGRCH